MVGPGPFGHNARFLSVTASARRRAEPGHAPAIVSVCFSTRMCAGIPVMKATSFPFVLTRTPMCQSVKYPCRHCGGGVDLAPVTKQIIASWQERSLDLLFESCPNATVHTEEFTAPTSVAH